MPNRIRPEANASGVGAKETFTWVVSSIASCAKTDAPQHRSLVQVVGLDDSHVVAALLQCWRVYVYIFGISMRLSRLRIVRINPSYPHKLRVALVALADQTPVHRLEKPPTNTEMCQPVTFLSCISAPHVEDHRSIVDLAPQRTLRI